jgi:hypothetical protein
MIAPSKVSESTVSNQAPEVAIIEVSRPQSADKKRAPATNDRSSQRTKRLVLSLTLTSQFAIRLQINNLVLLRMEVRIGSE